MVPAPTVVAANAMPRCCARFVRAGMGNSYRLNAYAHTRSKF